MHSFSSPVDVRSFSPSGIHSSFVFPPAGIRSFTSSPTGTHGHPFPSPFLYLALVYLGNASSLPRRAQFAVPAAPVSRMSVSSTSSTRLLPSLSTSSSVKTASSTFHLDVVPVETAIPTRAFAPTRAHAFSIPPAVMWTAVS
ncbi:hypothetical protein B0H17DRAFT_1198573 [Mycena rosella]|uniref:Uncharacterized protein n=1 Tax=Mycena rosella TaxID=1033263 RepID=A0AAD7GHY0_MYCRO|nr:hypothetical protein B0H17DRAFT_1198573 [Mycena rosella]